MGIQSLGKGFKSVQLCRMPREFTLLCAVVCAMNFAIAVLLRIQAELARHFKKTASAASNLANHIRDEKSRLR